MTSDEFRTLLKSGASLPPDLNVVGNLYLDDCALSSLPAGLNVDGVLLLRDCVGLTSLPPGLKVGGGLNLQRVGLTSLPLGLKVGGYLDLTGCVRLTSLPPGLKVGRWLDLRGCISLTSLPPGLKVGLDLYLTGCANLASLPSSLKVGGSLYLDGCVGLTSLPPGLNVGGSLFLQGCTALTSLPPGLNVVGNLVIDPHHVVPQDAKVKHWYVSGVDVPESVAKRTLDANGFDDLDAEQRRVWIQMVGVKWLVDNLKPKIVDMDDHPMNGQRALLLVERRCILVCGDPSTGRVYYMEVPSRTKTCQEADGYLNFGLDQKRQVGRT